MKHATFIVLLVMLIHPDGVAQTRVKEKISASEMKHGTLLTEKLTSTILRDNLTGLDPNRTVKIYLPPGYAMSGTSYPVVYYCHNLWGSANKMFEDGKIVNLLERGFANGIVKEFIFVVADYSTPGIGSLYENSPVSGRWLDFTANELVPFIDGKFRTLRKRESRALAGDFMGGRGALKLAMVHAELFSVVYALHPVATGNGYLPWATIGINWKKIHEAKSFADLQGTSGADIFVTVCQAFLPNPGRPPFYCDFFMDLENGELKLNAENVSKAKEGFHLEETLTASASNLKTMRGIAFDWARFDSNQDHVVSNRVFSRKLEDLGVEHEAEEYRGTPFTRNWTDDGRFYTRVLPFFSQRLVFE